MSDTEVRMLPYDVGLTSWGSTDGEVRGAAAGTVGAVVEGDVPHT